MSSEGWPQIALDPSEATYGTLHRWSQIVGKVRLSKMPWINHSWHVSLYVTARGLTTSAMPDGDRAFEIEFDFIDHRLQVATSEGGRRSFALETTTVADFYHEVMRALGEVGVRVQIWPEPVEIPGPTLPFPEDVARAGYDPQVAQRFWRALVQVQRVFTLFRARFVGKVSPVHLFWGAFDLAVTRFSGRAAPEHPGGAPHLADWVMREAYSREVSSAGFWPGAGLGEPAFYAYAYPEPDGFRQYAVRPEAAYYHEQLGEFILPYEAVRTAEHPDAALLEFLQSTYRAAADLAHWDRDALERAGPKDV